MVPRVHIMENELECLGDREGLDSLLASPTIHKNHLNTCVGRLDCNSKTLEDRFFMVSKLSV